MIRERHKTFLLFFILFITQSSFATIDDRDTLKGKSYEALRLNSLYHSKKDTSLSRVYAYGLLKKAKRENNINQILIGHHLLSLVEDEKNSLIHMDSIIILSDNKTYERYPLIGYLLKGRYYYKERNFKKSLDNFLIAYELSKKQPKDRIHTETLYSIGLIRQRTGNYDKALEDYRAAMKSLDTSQERSDYLKLLFAMSSIFYDLNKIDSAQYYSNNGYKISKELNSNFHHYFQTSEGVIHYEKENYQTSIDSLSKGAEYFKEINDLPNLSYTHHYRGLAYFKQDKKEKSIYHFKKVDSIFNILNDIHPKLRSSWEILIDHSKKQEDVTKELYYIKQLIKVDSILNDNYRYLDRNINNKYDIPLLIARKETLINEEKYKNRSNVFIIWILGFLILFSIMLLIFHKKRQKEKEKKFKNIISNLKKKISFTNQNVIENKDSSKQNTISKDVLETISIRLADLEDKTFFLTNRVTIGETAKKIGTNSKYLSNYINTSYNKNFNQYINDLRVEYAIERLKNDRLFRKWTLIAIAEEIGFNSREYFSNAFKKRYGITPSYYIKKLDVEFDAKKKDS